MHTSERYIYLGKGIYIKGITLKHSCSFTQKRFLRHGCPRALQGNWITKKRKYKLPLFDIGRDYWIRTNGILLPKQALYQAELSPETVPADWNSPTLTHTIIKKKYFCKQFFIGEEKCRKSGKKTKKSRATLWRNGRAEESEMRGR